MTYDPEVPNGFQDADIEMAGFQAQAAHADAQRRRGICVHGYQWGYKIGYTEHMIDPGEALCMDCGAILSGEPWDNQEKLELGWTGQDLAKRKESV